MNRPEPAPGSTEMEQAFFRDGYLLAADHLEKEGLSDPAISAMKQLYTMLDEFLVLFLDRAGESKNPAACKKGCAYCCHQAVFAQAHEFRYLKNWMFVNLDAESLDNVRKRAKQKLQNTKDLPREKRLRHKEPCPLLADDTCIAYEARPVACRIYLSMDLQSCINEYNDPENPATFPNLFELPLLAGRKFNEGFSAGLKQAGIDTREFPVEEGLLL